VFHFQKFFWAKILVFLNNFVKFLRRPESLKAARNRESEANRKMKDLIKAEEEARIKRDKYDFSSDLNEESWKGVDLMLVDMEKLTSHEIMMLKEMMEKRKKAKDRVAKNLKRKKLVEPGEKLKGFKILLFNNELIDPLFRAKFDKETKTCGGTLVQDWGSPNTDLFASQPVCLTLPKRPKTICHLLDFISIQCYQKKLRPNKIYDAFSYKRLEGYEGAHEGLRHGGQYILTGCEPVNQQLGPYARGNWDPLDMFSRSPSRSPSPNSPHGSMSPKSVTNPMRVSLPSGKVRKTRREVHCEIRNEIVREEQRIEREEKARLQREHEENEMRRTVLKQRLSQSWSCDRTSGVRPSTMQMMQKVKSGNLNGNPSFMEQNENINKMATNSEAYLRRCANPSIEERRAEKGPDTSLSRWENTSTSFAHTLPGDKEVFLSKYDNRNSMRSPSNYQKNHDLTARDAWYPDGAGRPEDFYKRLQPLQEPSKGDYKPLAREVLGLDLDLEVKNIEKRLSSANGEKLEKSLNLPSLGQTNRSSTLSQSGTQNSIIRGTTPDRLATPDAHNDMKRKSSVRFGENIEVAKIDPQNPHNLSIMTDPNFDQYDNSLMFSGGPSNDTNPFGFSQYEFDKTEAELKRIRRKIKGNKYKIGEDSYNTIFL